MRTAAAACALLASTWQTAAALPSLRPYRRSGAALREFARAHASQPPNVDPVLPEGEVAQRTMCRCVAQLGSGDQVYEACLSALHAPLWDLGWAELAVHREVPSAITTHVRCLGVWCANPCRMTSVVAEEPVQGGGRRSSLTFTTVRGHLLAGDERFTLYQAGDGRVYWDQTSTASPAGPLGVLASPVISRLQRKFFEASLFRMRQAAADSANHQALPRGRLRARKGKPLNVRPRSGTGGSGLLGQLTAGWRSPA